MIRYLIDSSALWRVIRDPAVRRAWESVIIAEAVGSCHAQRIEFRRSARDRDEFDQMSEMFERLYPDVPVHESVPRWIDAAQYRLVGKGRHQGLSVVDLTVAATAVHHGITVLHDDNDFVTIAGAVGDLHQRNVHELPDLRFGDVEAAPVGDRDKIDLEGGVQVGVAAVRPESARNRTGAYSRGRMGLRASR